MDFRTLRSNNKQINDRSLPEIDSEVEFDSETELYGSHANGQEDSPVLSKRVKLTHEALAEEMTFLGGKQSIEYYVPQGQTLGHEFPTPEDKSGDQGIFEKPEMVPLSRKTRDGAFKKSVSMHDLLGKNNMENSMSSRKIIGD